MRLRLQALVTLFAFALVSAPPANADWSPIGSPDAGFHEIIVEDTVDFFRQFSFLNAYKGAKEYVCADMANSDCRKLDAAHFNVILPICSSTSQFDCIAGIRASVGGKSEAGVFERYTMPRHPSLFRGDGKRLPENPQSPSVWNLPLVPHEGGTKYVIHAGFAGGINKGVVTEKNFYAQIYAVEEVPGRGEAFDQYNYSNFNWCDFNPVTREVNGCGGGGSVAGETCVVQFQIGGSCGAKRPIPKNVEITLNLRLSQEPSGWYHGRLGSPALAMSKAGKGVNLSITGSTVEVPILYHSGYYDELPDPIKRYWDNCAKVWSCPKSTSQFGADLERQPGKERNLVSEQKAWTPQALDTVKFFKQYTNGETPKLEQVWAVRSLENSGSRGGKCYSSKGFKGMITTNATAYSDGPPVLTKGILRYSLAAPNKNIATQEEILGNYSLVMRTSFANCVYGNKTISPRAEISVTSLNGDYRVATSVTSRSSSWIRVSANNFNY